MIEQAITVISFAALAIGGLGYVFLRSGGHGEMLEGGDIGGSIRLVIGLMATAAGGTLAYALWGLYENSATAQVFLPETLARFAMSVPGGRGVRLLVSLWVLAAIGSAALAMTRKSGRSFNAQFWWLVFALLCGTLSMSILGPPAGLGMGHSPGNPGPLFP